MATIALYAGKVNLMPGLLKETKQSVTDYKAELTTLKSKTLSINKSICDLEEVISSIQASTQIQEDFIDSLDTFEQNTEEFIEEVVRIDRDVADIVRKRKEEFYEAFSYLKPEAEKNLWEKYIESYKKAGEWCRENWKSIGKLLLTGVIIIGLGIAAALTGGILAVILAGAFFGALAGALIGGIMGGTSGALKGGSFLEGFADGALSGSISGAVTGAVFAGVGAAGSALGTYLGGSCRFAERAGQILNVMKGTSRVTGVLSIGMDGFDAIALVAGFFNPEGWVVTFHEKLHSNSIYNAFQIGVNVLAVFSGTAALSMADRMKLPPVCFVAGTLILTLSGLVAIENLRAGDKVLATDPETFLTEEKTVIETYIRNTRRLVHLSTEMETITTTENHPFYVKDRGFVDAGNLCPGDELVTATGAICLVESVRKEVVEIPETVYNFQVEDYHTYHVGNNGILVHNTECGGTTASSGVGEGKIESGTGVGNIAGKLDTNNIPNMTKQDIIDSIPDDWNYTEHNGFVHIRDADGNIRIRIDPPDKITNYPHVHAYDSDGNLLDSAGNIVDRKNP